MLTQQLEEAQKKYLGTNDAAIYLDTKPQVLRTSRWTGTLFGRPAPKHYKVGERKVLYAIEDLDAFVLSAPHIKIVGGQG